MKGTSRSIAARALPPIVLFLLLVGRARAAIERLVPFIGNSLSAGR